MPVWLIVSSHGWRLLRAGVRYRDEAALRTATGADWSSVTCFPDSDRGAPAGVGLAPATSGMVICPCSMGTVAAIAAWHQPVAGGAGGGRDAQGAAEADPGPAGDAALAGAPPQPQRRSPRPAPSSSRPRRDSIIGPSGSVELVDFIVQRILDQLGLEISIAPRWQG